MARRNPKPYQPGLLITGKRVVIASVAIVAVLSHAAVGVWAWDKPIMTLADDDDGPAIARPIRVKRAAPDDYSYTPPPAEPDQGPTADDLVKRLLESDKPGLVSDPLNLDVELRPLDEINDASAGALEIDLPAFEIKDDVLAGLDNRPGELEFGVDPGEGGTNAGGTGDGKGSADLANDALGTTAAAPIRTFNIPNTGTEPLVSRPELDGTTDISDVPPVTAPSLDPPEIDFVDLALGETTKIEVPDVLDNDFTYRVTRFDPTDRRGRVIDPKIEAGYFRVDITTQRSLSKLKTMPKDVIFLIDTSSSISDKWVKEIAKGVGSSLVSLNEGDRFNVVLFNDKVSLLSDAGPIDANKDNAAAAKDFLKNAEAVGYTDVNAAMRGLLIRDVKPGRVYDLVLISDGQPNRGVVNTRDLINLITQDNDLVAGIYCVGVGRKQNRELLNFLAYRNKGYSEYADDPEDASVTIQKLLSKLRFPIIKDVRLDVAGLDSSSLFPADLPDIHQNQTIQVYGRFTEPGPFTMRLTGRSEGKDVEFTFRRDLKLADRGTELVAQQWAFWKLHDLYSLIIREGEKEELLDQIEDLSDKYDLETLY